MLYIGDVHRKWKEYTHLIKGHPASVQVGDFGLGYPGQTQKELDDLEAAIAQGDHRMIRGNHDNPKACREHPFCMDSGTVVGGRMYVGGARSIDQDRLTENFDWWRDEEHTYEEFGDLINLYEATKPEVMVTHDGPKTVALHIHKRHQSDAQKSITSQALEIMFEIWKPSVWIYGHWHESKRINILGTEFICLNELETIEI